MKQYLRCYQMFLPGNYLWLILNIVYPAIVIAFAYRMRGYGNTTCLILASVLAMSVEILLDYFSFSGLASKKEQQMEYLKSSPVGLDCLKKSLVTDAARRFASITVIVFCVWLVLGGKGEGTEGIGLIFLLIVFTFLMEEVAFCITRYFSLIWLNMIVCGAMEMVWLMCVKHVYWDIYEGNGMMMILPCVIVLGIAAFSVNVWQIMRQTRRSFYDA